MWMNAIEKKRAKLDVLAAMRNPRAKRSAETHMTERGVARCLGVRHEEVRLWRARGEGPAHVRVKGKARYPQDAFMQWLSTLPRPHGMPSLPDGLRH